MQDHHFEKNSDKPHYYVFIEQQGARNYQDQSAFYRYDTAEEAMALFQYLQTEQPHASFSLGVHKDYSRRAAIVLHVNGINALSDDIGRTAPWKSDLGVMLAAREAVKRLGVTWKVDRELIGSPVLLPNEPPSHALPWYFEGRTLCPDDPANPLTSIREVNVEGAGWVSLDSLRLMAGSHGRAKEGMPLVRDYLIECRTKNGFQSTDSIPPSDFKLMERRYIEQQKGREASLDADSLGDLKREAGERATRRRSERPVIHAVRQPERSL